MADLISEAVNEHAWQQARQREDAARYLAREHLPKRLGWIVDHPRLLRAAYALRRKWRPILYVATDLNCSVVTGRTPDGVTVVVSESNWDARTGASEGSDA